MYRIILILILIAGCTGEPAVIDEVTVTDHTQPIGKPDETLPPPIINEPDPIAPEPESTTPSDPCIDAYNKPLCYYDYAIEINDSDICLKSGYKQWECQDYFLLQHAMVTRNKADCVPIINDEIKEGCYTRIKFKKY